MGILFRYPEKLGDETSRKYNVNTKTQCSAITGGNTQD